MSKNGTTGKNRAKGWFITWPRCSIEKEKMLENLKNRYVLEEYVISREQHQDGAFHLHAFVKLIDRIVFKKDMFDFEGYHPNVQVAKSWKAVVSYVKKGDDFIANINIESALQKKGKKNIKLLETNAKDLIEGGEVAAMDLPKLLKAQHAWRELKYTKTDSDEVFLEKKRHLWLYGPPNSGKTTILRKLKQDLGYDNFFQIPKNDDWAGYDNQRYLWIDEFKGQLSVQQLNSACDGESKVNVKGASAILRRNTFVIVASNYNIEECYKKLDSTSLDALNSRFNEKICSHELDLVELKQNLK